MPLIRRVAGVCACAVAFLAYAPGSRSASAVGTTDPQAMYILPSYAFGSASDAEFANEVQQLRTRIGEGPRVRLGFTTYVAVAMDWTVDPADASAVRQSLAPTVTEIDRALARARAYNIPVCLSFLTYIRSLYDPAQLESERQDRRVSQWHSDNSLAAGWWTYSRYARRQIRLREAYIRELGRVVANRMALYPSTFVAASGDGESELSFDGGGLLADYSPFAVAEFRDWLRGGGLYAAGQPYRLQAFTLSSRYAGDATPALDSNGDGHTLNGDYGTAFATWSLRHFDWSLADDANNDPRAIPIAMYAAAGFNPLPGENPQGFDAPRVPQRGTPWWDLWDRFRATMVFHYNQDFAKWMTTSADQATRRTVPVDRWYSDQIPADYLFGGTPSTPNERLFTSASPVWTADVSPYGSIGITSFGVNFTTFIARTLPGVAPVIAQRDRPWAIFEWNPSAPPTDSLELYRNEMALIEQYRPRVVVPYKWTSTEGLVVKDTGFEIALRELVARIKDGAPADTRLAVDAPVANATISQPFTVSGWAIDLGTIRGPGWGPGVDVIGITAKRRGSATSVDFDTPVGLARGDVGALFGAQFTNSGFATTIKGLPVGTYDITVSARSTVTGTLNATQTVAVTIVAPAGIGPEPFGVVDTPLENAIVAGEVGVTGWALDDQGVAAVDVYRNAVATDASPTGLVYIGSATFVSGARPDVEAAYAGFPDANRAGWGLMVLSNVLPNGGNGTFPLTVVARDVEGRTTLLGTRTIDARNATLPQPFGTIDTPPQGATISGTYVNFGWAMTPQPNVIPFDGSTIAVYIDNVFAGRPVYNNYRADIAGLFPGLNNTNGAVGYFVIDTTKLSNGVHTIAWVAFDSAGNGTGMGSRYFTVQNGVP